MNLSIKLIIQSLLILILIQILGTDAGVIVRRQIPLSGIPFGIIKYLPNVKLKILWGLKGYESEFTNRLGNFGATQPGFGARSRDLDNMQMFSQFAQSIPTFMQYSSLFGG